MDDKKQRLMLSVISFLQDQLVNGNLNDERKESIEVAIQCLETAFELDSETRKRLEDDKIDLCSLFPAKAEVTEDNKKGAEECKNRGNTHMKNSEYNEAVAEYTKAISLNPNNAVYYCNRAAAYSRLDKHLDAIDDCKEAIKLDQSYGKAYGRLGIAYCNLNRFEDARQALRTALKYDPNNPMYETNLKLAEEKMCASTGTGGAGGTPNRMSFSELVNHPSIVDVCNQMISNPQIQNLMLGLMLNENDVSRGLRQTFGDNENPTVQNLFQAAEQIVQRLHSVDPSVIENIREAYRPHDNSTGSNEDKKPNDSTEKPNS